jgi:KaiC/GvpD/RAD55 family RecA-like ATPase
MGESDQASERVGPIDPIDRLAAASGTNLLVVGPPMSGKRSFGLSVLAGAAGNGRDVLVVTASKRVTSLPFDPTEAGRFGVVDCTPGHVEEEGPVVDVGSPGDLTGISMPVSRFLDGAENPVVLLDSISSILQYADEESAFRFLSVLTSNVAAGGGVGLYTFDEGVHPEQTYRTFAQLFGGRVDLRDGGTSASGGDGEFGPATEIRVSGVAGIPNEWVAVDPD